MFVDKTFAYSHKTTKFMKIFSLESFPLYGILLHLPAIVPAALISSQLVEVEQLCTHLGLHLQGREPYINIWVRG